MRNQIARRSTSLALAATLFLGVPAVALADEPASPAPTSASTGVAPAPAAPWSSGFAPYQPAYGPPARPYVTMASPPDGWGTSQLTQPPGLESHTYKPRTRRNKAMAAAGGIVMGTGFLTGLAGVYLGMGNLDCEMFLIFPSCHAHDQGVATASEAMMIGGLVTLVIGIPILVTGLKKRPAPSALTSFVGEPAPSGWAWRF